MCEHKGSWRNAFQATARKLVITGKKIWTDHQHETREVLSEAHRYSHQSAMQVDGFAQGRKRSGGQELRNGWKMTGQGPGG